MKTITIYEDTKIPGTDIILETGDQISILTEADDFNKMQKFLDKRTDFAVYFSGRQDQIVYHLLRFDKYKDKPRFLRLYTDGSFTVHYSKYKDADVIYEGRGLDDLMRVCEELDCLV